MAGMDFSSNETSSSSRSTKKAPWESAGPSRTKSTPSWMGGDKKKTADKAQRPATDPYPREPKGDRPPAFQPNNAPEALAPPSFWQMCVDLFLRAAEVAIGAVALEVWRYFQVRRFTYEGYYSAAGDASPV